MAAHEVYPAKLCALARRYALWEPTPGIDAVTNRHKRAVRVGDVGYMHMGMFQTYTLRRMTQNRRRTYQNTSNPSPSIEANVYKSGGVQSVGVVFGAEGPMLAGATASFTATRHQGAILAVAGKVDVENILCMQDYKNYIIKNIERWHASTVRNGLGLKMEQIMLVSGRDLVKSWANAAFCNTEFEASVSLEADIAMVSGIKLAVNVRFSNIDGADYGWGPQQDELVDVPTQASAGPGADPERETSPSTDVAPSSSNTFSPLIYASAYHGRVIPPDQCIFMRRYRVKHRWFLGKKLFANAEPRNPNEDDSEDRGEGEDMTSSVSENEVLVDSELEPLLTLTRSVVTHSKFYWTTS
ncbi:hypothetical protein OF83DRAFT_1084666 [Amylostereum chailletii]|nr:hypothetical protein OF83DRAFT_1084666 [Amylostereum chailletii]